MKVIATLSLILLSCLSQAIEPSHTFFSKEQIYIYEEPNEASRILFVTDPNASMVNLEQNGDEWRKVQIHDAFGQAVIGYTPLKTALEPKELNTGHWLGLAIVSRWTRRRESLVPRTLHTPELTISEVNGTAFGVTGTYELSLSQPYAFTVDLGLLKSSKNAKLVYRTNRVYEQNLIMDSLDVNVSGLGRFYLKECFWFGLGANLEKSLSTRLSYSPQVALDSPAPLRTSIVGSFGGYEALQSQARVHVEIRALMVLDETPLHLGLELRLSFTK